jgi:hypothetical protein
MSKVLKIILAFFCSSDNKIQSKNNTNKQNKFSQRCEKLGLSVALDIDIDNFEKSSENKFDNNKKDKIWKVECDNWYSYSYKPGIVPLQSWFGFETVFSIINFRNKIGNAVYL